MAFANHMMNPSFVLGVKTVVFDCDGVLIDSYDANMRYYGMLKEQLGLPPMTEDERIFVHTHTHKEAIEHIAPGKLFEKAWEVVRKQDSSAFAQYLKRSDGVREFLCWLRGAGFSLAVNTSRTDTMDYILSLMDLEGVFPAGDHLGLRSHAQAASRRIAHHYARTWRPSP